MMREEENNARRKKSSTITQNSGLSSEVTIDIPKHSYVTSSGQTRDAGLDFTKGALVLLMVLYHWLNYFVPLREFDYYRYVRFITPSFIFLAGFLITNLLSNKISQNSSALSIRLFIRGVKLLALFTILNMGVAWIENGKFSSCSIAGVIVMIVKMIPSLYTSGDGVSFFVLLPISYTLMLAAFFEKTRYLLGIYNSRLIILVFVIASSVILSGIKSALIELIAFGLFGLIIGRVFSQNRDRLRQLLPWFALAYIPHLAALTIWGVPYILQLISVCMNLSLLYCLGHLVRPSNAIARLMLLLGQYTLLGYVGQIAILQILSRTFRRIELGPLEATVALAIALLLTVTLIIAIDSLRRTSLLVNSLYRLVFA